MAAGEHVLDRAEHERQRRAELVADVGEEGDLGPVHFGQRLGPLPLLLVGTGVGNGSGHTGGEQVVEAPVRLVQRQAGADTDDEDGGGPVGPRRKDRQHQGGIRRLLVGAVGGRAETPGHVVHPHRRPRPDGFLQRPNGFSRRPQAHRLRAAGRACREASRTDEPSLKAVRVQCVEQNERQIEVVFGEGLSGQGEGVLDGLRLARAGGEVTQRPYPPLAEHLGRHLDDGVEQPADPPGLVPNGAEREREEGFLQVPVPFEENVLGFEEGRVTRQGRVVRPADDRPRLLEALREVPPQQPGVLASANDSVAVVVDLDEARPPDDADGEVRCEANIDGRAQTLRPRLDGAERRPRPVHRPDQVGPSRRPRRGRRGGRRRGVRA